MSVVTFLRILLRALLALPAEVLLALWRLLLVLLLVLLYALRFVWELLERTFGKRHEEPGRRQDCGEIPQHVKRKPDPCLYDQFYLTSLGYSVTWDNPDIWITLPNGTPVNSYALSPDTDYTVHAQIHNASFDPALATHVRCFYRPWSFNTPDRVPIELNPDNTEKIVVLHIMPWSQQVAQFNWRTPNTPNAHYCLQVECYHPDDLNPNNNLGQENTQIIGAAAGASFSAKALLVNTLDRGRWLRIAGDQYHIPEGDLGLTLRTRTLPIRKRQQFDALHRILLTRDGRERRIKSQNAYVPSWTAYAYRGFDQLHKTNARGLYPLDPSWQTKVNGTPFEHGSLGIEFAPGEAKMIDITGIVPTTAIPGRTYNFNFTAFNELGKVLGGVTVKVQVV